MSLLTANIFRGSIFKQLKFLVSSPQKAQLALHLNESGTVQKEPLPLETGWMGDKINNKSWEKDDIAKLRILKNGMPTDESVIPICDRSFRALYPLKQRDKETHRSLVDIAGTIHDQELINLGNQNDKPTDIIQAIIVGGYIILGICVVAEIFMRRG